MQHFQTLNNPVNTCRQRGNNGRYLFLAVGPQGCTKGYIYGSYATLRGVAKRLHGFTFEIVAELSRADRMAKGHGFKRYGFKAI